ncbi:MAG: hypothetical protein KVP17_000023 [Porospora cf. gigantea B]|uniref:uncharacterized protein n=1 Tax=Porospora cf. gigantea B TaxID=2853592 RepID=UPI003571D3D8|nr:MAG: hypothetical protein KVP17_000023 [Porospora cf. gigantea B]
MLAAVKETGCKRLLLSPTAGPTQSGDVPLVIRVKCYEAVLSEFPPDIEVDLVLLPLAMRMAGPREAVWHALIRKNYGCTFFVVGRDHAGPSTRNSLGESFYGPYEAQEVLAGVAAEAGIRPYFAKNVVYCGKELGYLQEDQAPQDAPQYHISGTKLREMLASAAAVPEWFSFPKVLQTLRQTYNNRGLCVYITGLPCSGKSTMALYLQAQMQEASSRPITVLDADIIRQHLSKGLGFSREDRSDNVKRIGYVASEIVKHGGICLVANIAPYSQDRAFNRRLISEQGVYIEVYLSTPVEVCETRDVKHFYKRARDGKIPNFTGVSGVYEIPLDADVTVDSSSHLAENGQAVMDLLRTRGIF